MIVPGFGQIFEIDLEPELTSRFQRLSSRTERGVGTLLNGLAIVVGKRHFQVDFADWPG